MVMPLDVAGEPVGQAALEVITTVTMLPFTKELLE
jgi:hypothetical protein